MGASPALDTDERPLVLIWEVTQACDLSCRHCRADAMPERHPAELSTAEGRALLESIREFGDGQLVVLSGGDPLYRDDIVDLVEYGTDLGLLMTLTPSGTASLSSERLEALADAGLRRLAVSLDGTSAATHDDFRGEAGSFEQTVAAARAASVLDIPIQINTTVCAETVGELPDIAALVEELDAVMWSVFFLVPVGRGRVLEPITPEQAEAVMEWLLAIQSDVQFGIKTTEAPHVRRVALQVSEGNADGTGRRSGIIAGDGFAFVSHTGEVYPSGFLPISAGSVLDESIVDIYRSAPLFTRLRDRDALEGDCGMCEFRHVCGGSRSRAYAHTGNPFASDPLCPYVPAGP